MYDQYRCFSGCVVHRPVSIRRAADTDGSRRHSPGGRGRRALLPYPELHQASQLGGMLILNYHHHHHQQQQHYHHHHHHHHHLFIYFSSNVRLGRRTVTH